MGAEVVDVDTDATARPWKVSKYKILLISVQTSDFPTVESISTCKYEDVSGISA